MKYHYSNYITIIHAISFLLVLIACNSDEPKQEPDPNAERTNSCGTYPPQETSPFILPYKAGEACEVTQANCTNNSHRKGTLGQFAYDIRMPIGTDIIAVRAGMVVAIQESFPNVTTVQKPGEENFVIIINSNGTQDRYFHLDQDGVHVSIGQIVSKGQLIATGGNSGGTPFPHLHLEVIQPTTGGGIPIPVTFSNTKPHPTGLVRGQVYKAE